MSIAGGVMAVRVGALCGIEMLASIWIRELRREIGAIARVVETALCLSRVLRVFFSTVSKLQATPLTPRLAGTAARIRVNWIVLVCEDVAVERTLCDVVDFHLVDADSQAGVIAAQGDGFRGDE